MTTKRSESSFKRCRFAYSDGRYCTMPAIADTGLCFRHTKQPEPPPPDFNADIFMNFQPFTNDPPTEDEVHSAS